MSIYLPLVFFLGLVSLKCDSTKENNNVESDVNSKNLFTNSFSSTN